ncbi:MAG TPA: hypothetical protein DDZ67_04530 [Xanthomonadaceae bacterium]|nr:hypothetical protein [Xanthomonadaceae bacterium]
MKSLLLRCLALSCLSLSAQAHEIWIERDGAGPVRVYFGEPAEEAADHDEDEIKRIVKPKVFGASAQAGALERGAGHLTAPLKGEGDAWLFDDKVFEPWQGEDGKFESVTYYARAGRASTAPKLDLELVPSQPGGNALTVLYRNQPLAGAEVTVIDPQKWQKQLKSDAQGQLTLPALRDGRHIVVVSHKEPVQQQIAGKQVAVMHHISTLTFLAE